MKPRMVFWMTLVLLLVFVAIGLSQAQGPAAQAPMGTVFTYQGRLNDGGNPANGTYDLEFKLYDALSGGSQVGSTVTKAGVAVSHGLFAVELDFGGVFDGTAVWLEVGVKGEGETGYTALSPRQALTPTPYALYAAGGPFWSLTGNAGTNPTVNFIGTTDNVPLELRVNGQRALRLEPTETSPNVIGGYAGNSAGADVRGATISGGGQPEAGWGENPNVVTDNYGTIGGGLNNRAGDGGTDNLSAHSATVAGGYNNTASGLISAVGGGKDNTASARAATVGGGTVNVASGLSATVAGGDSNTAGGDDATVAGGYNNIADEYISTVGGGRDNTASGGGAVIAGGAYNVASGQGGTIGGGRENVASGLRSTVPGGFQNTAEGDYSFAAGRGAKALHDGSFVWADTQEWTESEVWELASTDENQFLVRAGGGVSFNATDVGHEEDGRPYALPGGGIVFRTTNVSISSVFGSLLTMQANWWEDYGIYELSPNIVFGYSGNSIGGNTVGATIGGGGGNYVEYPGGEPPHPYQYGPRPNLAFGNFSTVGGGWENTAGPEEPEPGWVVAATVAGGAGNTAGAGSATVGGGSGNTASGTASTVSGGGSNSATDDYAIVSGGEDNTASAAYSAISGGSQNTIDSSGYGGAIGGGQSNVVENQFSTVGGGEANSATGSHSTVGGGKGNNVIGGYGTVAGGDGNHADNLHAAVGGGKNNTAMGQYSAIPGGFNNTASNSASTVAGGQNNTADGWGATVAGGNTNNAVAHYATVGGGASNTASGTHSTIPGGYMNTALGSYSFAAGYKAQANANGCFVWGDSNNAEITCTVPNRWMARATGGILFYSNAALSTGVYVAAGGSSWNVISDRAVKENFAAIDSQDILEKVAAMPIESWNLKSQDDSIRHIGPVAQDFHAAFGFGESDTAINLEDADGVALSAIQGLYQVVQEQKGEIETLKEQNADLEARLSALEAAVNGGAAKASPVSLPTGVLPGAGVLVACLGVVWLKRKGGER